jgi:hypothetical protein
VLSDVLPVFVVKNPGDAGAHKVNGLAAVAGLLDVVVFGVVLGFQNVVQCRTGRRRSPVYLVEVIENRVQSVHGIKVGIMPGTAFTRPWAYSSLNK